MKKRAARILAILFVVWTASSAEAAKVPPDLLDRLEQPSREAWLPAADQIVAMRRDGARLLREQRWRVPSLQIGARYDSLINQIACLHADLSLEPRTLRVGQEFFYDVTLRNESEEKWLVAPSLDGAEDGVRAPRIGLEITDAAGTPVDPGPRWCRAGQIARMHETDFRWIDAGASRRLFESPRKARVPGHWYWTPSQPGLYRVRFVYDASAAEWDAWRGRSSEPTEAVRLLWRSIHHQRAESEWVTIHVID